MLNQTPEKKEDFINNLIHYIMEDYDNKGIVIST